MMHTPHVPRPTRLAHVLLAAVLLGAAGCPGEPDAPVPTPTPAPPAPTAVPPTPTPSPPTVVLLVRHAEKLDDPSTDDPPLSAAGRTRARKLVHMLAASGVTAIHATHFRRTQQTAEPLARQLGLSIEVTVAREVDEMVGKILASPPGSVVLAVGHSDSVVTMVEKLGAPPVEPIEHEDYDNLYIVTIYAPGKATVAALQFGAPT